MIKLRKKIKPLIKKPKILFDYINYKLYCKVNKQREYILYGTPLHGNIGDQAITVSEYKLFKDLNLKVFEVSSFERKYIIKYMSKHIKKDAVICIHGGGFVGNQWIREEQMVRDVVSTFKYNKIIIFPQTVYYLPNSDGRNEFEISKQIYNNHNNITICTREQTSFEFVKENWKKVNCILIPDMVLYLDSYNFNIIRQNALICFRSDYEKKIQKVTELEVEQALKSKFDRVDFCDTIIDRNIKPKERKMVFGDMLKKISQYNIVITDRLHAMIFCILTNTPCIVFGNYNHKIKGVYEFICDLGFVKFIEDCDSLTDNIELVMLNKKSNYVSLKNQFTKLIDILIN